MIRNHSLSLPTEMFTIDDESSIHLINPEDGHG